MIELMVVILLIGILSAMILPEMKGTFGDALLRASGRELIDVFNLAYSQAVSQNRACLVRLDPTSGRYQVEGRVPNRGRALFVPLKEVAGSSGRIDSRIAFSVRKQSDDASEIAGSRDVRVSDQQSPSSSPAESITFFPDGTADRAEVLLQDQSGFALRLRVDPITARVDVQGPARGEPQS